MENKNHILIVDDDDRIRNLLKDYLAGNNYIVSTAENAEQAKKRLQYLKFDIVILDVMMPEMDGIEACEIIREDQVVGKTLITFLSARGEDYSQIAALNAGADDYITKPIKPKVLLSKVKSLLRRISNDQNEIIEFKNLTIDKTGYRVFVEKNEISLPRKEFELLFLLASKPDKVFKRDFILKLRNEFVANKVISSEDNKIVIIYGASHLNEIKRMIESKNTTYNTVYN